MPARTGQEYLNRLGKRPADVRISGERIADPTSHPALANGARTIASLYDLQSDPAERDTMTFVSPLTGDRIGSPSLSPTRGRNWKRGA